MGFKIDSDGYKNGSQILFEGSFEMLRIDISRCYNEFLWNAYCVLSIGPDVGQPHFIFFGVIWLKKYWEGQFDS